MAKGLFATSLALSVWLCGCLVVVVLGNSSAKADDVPTEAALIEALRKKAGTRSAATSDPARASEEQALIESLRSKDVRSITIEERKRVADIAAQRPQIDLEILFAFDSEVILPEAVPVLVALGRALANSEFAASTFLVAGHTDAKGSATYNQGLSERRAAAVKGFLVEQFKLDPARIIALGYGFERLKIESNPFAGENRRVQVVNLVEQ
jgi:outer membrane protein OmpA-like peptidoglycan-associated protein